MLACQQPFATGKGDHGTIISTKLKPWVGNFPAIFFPCCQQTLPEGEIGPDTAGYDQLLCTGVLHRAPAFNRQCINRGLLKTGADVSACIVLMFDYILLKKDLVEEWMKG